MKETKAAIALMAVGIGLLFIPVFIAFLFNSIVQILFEFAIIVVAVIILIFGVCVLNEQTTELYKLPLLLIGIGSMIAWLSALLNGMFLFFIGGIAMVVGFFMFCTLSSTVLTNLSSPPVIQAPPPKERERQTTFRPHFYFCFADMILCDVIDNIFICGFSQLGFNILQFSAGDNLRIAFEYEEQSNLNLLFVYKDQQRIGYINDTSQLYHKISDIVLSAEWANGYITSIDDNTNQIQAAFGFYIKAEDIAENQKGISTRLINPPRPKMSKDDELMYGDFFALSEGEVLSLRYDDYYEYFEVYSSDSYNDGYAGKIPKPASKKILNAFNLQTDKLFAIVDEIRYTSSDKPYAMITVYHKKISPTIKRFI